MRRPEEFAGRQRLCEPAQCRYGFVVRSPPCDLAGQLLYGDCIRVRFDCWPTGCVELRECGHEGLRHRQLACQILPCLARGFPAAPAASVQQPIRPPDTFFSPGAPYYGSSGRCGRRSGRSRLRNLMRAGYPDRFPDHEALPAIAHQVVQLGESAFRSKMTGPISGQRKSINSTLQTPISPVCDPETLRTSSR